MRSVAQCIWPALCTLALLAAGHPRGAAAEPTITINSARFGNLFELGETPLMRIVVNADAVEALGGRLEVTATDAYRRRAGRVEVRVDLAPGAAVSYELPLVSQTPLGHFTVNARLRNGRGRTLVEAESTAAIVPPVEPSDAEQSAVGYFAFPFPDDVPHASDITDQMRRLGIRWVRLTFNWWADGRRDRPDTSDPAWLDSAFYEFWVDEFRRSGIEVLGVLFGSARWASSAPDDLQPVAGIPRYGVVKPRDVDDWLLFARTLSERLNGRIGIWEVWNEPDILYFWQSEADDFASLARATADVLHAADPQMRVGVNLVDRGTEQGLAFSDTLLAGAGDALDMFGLHYGPDDWVADVVRLAPPLLRPGSVIWNTEALGAPRRQIARWLAQRTLGVERIFPYIYHTPLDDTQVEDFTQFGRYPVNLDYTPRPDAVAIRTLSDVVGSATPLGAEVVGLGYQAFTFRTASGPVTALADRSDLGQTWSGPPGRTLFLRVPRDVRGVTVIDLMGNRDVLTAHRGRLRLRLLGVAAFLQAEPPASLAGLRVVRARGRRR